MTNLAPFPGAVALITGASSGIGRTTSIELYRCGWKVVLSGRRQDELNKSMEMMKEAAPDRVVDDESAGKGPAMISVAGDVTVGENVEALFSTIKETYGRLDLLFNNAGIGGPTTPLEDLKIDDYINCMNVNVTVSVRCTKAAFTMMKEQTPQGGRIINNGSIAAYSPRPNALAYTISKHAITGLTKSTSLDGRKYGISCGQIDIGNAATAMGSHAAAGPGALQADGVTYKQEPMFDVHEVGRAVAFMGSVPRGGEVYNLTITSTGMPFIGRG